jgi:REP element-mobilizing transposase RayT
MPRNLRDQEPGAHYHVCTRGNNKHAIFDDELRYLFLRLVQTAAEAYDWRALAYALMGNHYHLVLKIGDRGLSDGMCTLNGRFARSSNSRFDRINHCFGQRFWSAHLATEHYVLNSVRYCYWNPPRAKLCLAPSDSTWTSFRSSVGIDNPHPVLAVGDLLGLFHAETGSARRALSDFVAEGRVRCQAPWEGPPST